MKKQLTIPEQIKDAVTRQDLEGLKVIKERIGLDKWLNQWGGKSVPIEAWLDDNPFVQWKE